MPLAATEKGRAGTGARAAPGAAVAAPLADGRFRASLAAPTPDATHRPPVTALAPMTAFALVTLAPAGLIALALAGLPAAAPAAAFLMTLGVLALDALLPRLAHPGAPDDAEFPAGDALLFAIGAAALVLLPLSVQRVASGALPLGAAVLTLLALGLWLGQVAVPAAHELIHRGGRGAMRLGVLLYVAILFGHHASAHRLVHHRHVATANDPNSARAGESAYRFLRRAWTGSFRAGQAAEARLAAEAGRGPAWAFGMPPYRLYLGGAVLVLVLAAALGGLAGISLWVTLALHAQAQLLLSDYVQHYGLVRPAGTPAGTAEAQSWDAGAWFSDHLTLRAGRHADHHRNPARPFPALRSDGSARLPWPLPLACTLALWPPYWRRAMAPRLRRLGLPDGLAGAAPPVSAS